MIPSQSMSNATLVGVDDKRAFDLNQSDTFIGRAKENDISFNGDISLSRRHAVISCIDGTYYVRDLRSSNGTLLNGKIVDGIEQLTPGDEIFVGRTRFLFCPSAEKLRSTLSYMSDEDTTVLRHAQPTSRTRFSNFIVAIKQAVKPSFAPPSGSHAAHQMQARGVR